MPTPYYIVVRPNRHFRHNDPHSDFMKVDLGSLLRRVGALHGRLGRLFLGSPLPAAHAQAHSPGHAEQQLAQLTDRLTLAIEGGSDGLWDWFDIDKEAQWWSPTYYALLGYEPSALDATAGNFMALLHPDFRSSHHKAAAAAMRDGAPFDLEIQMRTRTQGYRWFRMRAKVHRNAHGQAHRMSGALQDIHDRKLAQEDLRKTNERFAIAAETAGIGVWEWDLNTQHLSWDEQMYRLAGRSPRTASSDQSAVPVLLESLHAGDRQRFESDLRQAILSRGRFSGDCRIVWPNAEVHHIRAAARTIVGADNRVVRLTGVNFDITALKVAQESLAASEAFLGRAGRIAGVGGWRVDLVRQKIHWSKVTRSIHEVSDDYEPQLDEAIHFYAPEARPVIQAAVQAGMANGTPWDLELPMVTATGRRIWVRAVGEAEFADGKPVALVGAFQDVTERRARGDELRLFEASIARINDAIVITKADVLDGSGPQIVFVNPAFEKMTGFCEEDALGQTPRMLQGQGTDRKELARIKNALRQGETVRAELLNYTKDRVPYWIEIDISPIKSAQDEITHFVAVERDITERRAREEALRDAVQRAEQASASKGQFLANMSHEIRTPMNAIIGMLSLLHQTELTPQQLDYADKSQNAAHSLLALINDILDFSKVEAGKMTLDPQPFRLDQLLRELAVILSANVGAKDIEVLYDVAPDVPLVLLGDSMRLQQILINLAGNAVKFTAHGQVVIAIGVAHRSEQAAALQFAVKDSGIGIAPENQSRIFAGFSQAEASTTRKFGGTGLGLGISKRLIEIMGGELHLQSALGEGSTFGFTLEFPLPEVVPTERHTAPPPNEHARRVLVVDDNPVARALTARMAGSWQWSVDTVDSGEAALQRVASLCTGASFPYDVIYIDWHMPGIDGWETARRMRQLAPPDARNALTIIMVTANSRGTLAQRTAQEQALIDGFLVKPITASMLQEATLSPRCARAGLRQGRRAVAGQRRLNGLRILVVEDNLINQQVAEELLASEGALVSLAANGQLGVEAVRAAQPQFDAVLMDLQMPVLDGFAATRVIRQEPTLAALPIIAMTANAMASDRDACMAAGMSEHVGKPFKLTELVNMLLRFTRPPVAPDPAAAPALAHATSGAQPLAAEPATSQSAMPAPAPDSGVPGPVIALHEALERMSGMHALYLRAAREFVATLPAVVADFRAATPHAMASAVIPMHTLKGTAAMLGANALSALAARLEQLCKDGAGAHALAQESAPLEALARSTAQALQQAMAQLEASPDLDDAPVAAIPVHQLRADLQALQALLAQSDLAALQQFAEIRGQLGGLPQHELGALENALQSLELEDAHRYCSAILRRLEPV